MGGSVRCYGPILVSVTWNLKSKQILKGETEHNSHTTSAILVPIEQGCKQGYISVKHMNIASAIDGMPYTWTHAQKHMNADVCAL